MSDKTTKGYLLILLHAHLPFVRHPDYPDFLEEDWLFEGITETYIPLISMMEGLVRDGVDFRLTMSVTPTLASMLTDPLLQERYLKHLAKITALAEREISRTNGQTEFNRLARMYYDTFCHTRDIFENRYGCNLVNAFKQFQDLGKLDIVTCGATHGFLPNMEVTKSSVRAQVQIACDHYQSLFGCPPRGIWLPECGYQPGADEFLKEAGIQYFFLDAHGILHGSPRPKYGVFAPVICQTGVAAFGRDLESSKQVWSAEEGYPGNSVYREFYRDIGFDLDYDYIRPYLHGDGIRANTGIKYYRITGNSDHKEIYEPSWAREKAAEDAGNFMFNREKQAEYLTDRLKRTPIIVAPYDAELFGHWWYEGPQFLDFLIRKVSCDSKTLRLVHASEYLKAEPRNQVVTPSFSSWGYNGYSEVWLEGSNDWIYRHLHKASARMQELATIFSAADAFYERALKQAARELLLAESSDWAFMIKNGTTVEYARRRVCEHLLNFLKLYHDLKSNSLDQEWITKLEAKDNIFPNLNWRVYAS